jgi:hypothetical protein
LKNSGSSVIRIVRDRNGPNDPCSTTTEGEIRDVGNVQIIMTENYILSLERVNAVKLN